MAADARIVALFNLPVVSPPLCDAGSCVYLVDYLSKFHEHVAESASRHPWISKPEIDALGSSLHTLKATASHEKIDWMPEYGCALLKSRAGCTSGVIALNLISLDLHRFQTTSKQDSNNYSYFDSAVAKDYEIQHVGTCALDELQAIQVKFHRLLSSAQTQTGNNRTARGGKQGHQRTPAFIHALYREAFGSPNQLSRGGMTDVGLHTGDSQKRDTAPPLVFYSLYQALHEHEAVCGLPFSPDALYNKTVVYLGLYASQVMLQQCKAQESSGMNTNAPHTLLDYAFFILRSTSIKAATFSDDGLDLSFFVEWSKSLRGKILKEASSQSALYSQRYELPQSDAEIRGKYENYSFDLPARYSPPKDGALSEAEIRKNTHRNLGWIAVPDGRSLGDVVKWVKKLMPTTSQDVLSSMLLLRTVETHIWSYDTENLPLIGQTELETLASIVDNYREVLHNLKVNGKYLPLSLVELKSREFLVVWVAFCIIHSNVERLHKTEMEGYGVPLDFNDLSHLVLSRPDEWKVALRVAKYLGKYGTNRPIFSLKDEKSTFDCGRRIANASCNMVKIWEQEVEDASYRVEGHWKEVLRKQELARKLRQEIAQLHVELADANRKLIPKKDELAEHERALRSRYSWERSTYDHYAHNTCQDSVNTLTHTVNRLESQLSSKNSSLKSALSAPAPVFQPLPEKKSNAMPIIFFLYMPPGFQLLSRFSFTSQQLRLPQPWASAWGGNEGSQRFDLTSQVTRGSEICQLSWKDYYNSHQHSQYHRPSCSRYGSDSHLLLRSISNTVPQEVGPKSVDHIHSRTDGIWYPDQLKPRMAWFGGANSFDRAPSGCEINPFAKLDHFYLVANFTERLNGRNSALQWALMQPGERHILDTRGNLPYARQNIKPSWLSKTEYLSYTNMRSYPNIQLSNILVAIQERQLPLTNGPVHTLINQTLFHIGEISDIETCPKLEWKRDLDDHAFGNDAYEIFESLYEEIKDSPKTYMCVKIIGKLLNCFSSWEPRCRDTARKLAMSVCQWADNLGSDIEKSPPSKHPIVRAKQVVLYQHAILTLAGGSLSDIDASLLIKLVVKCRNYFTGDNRSGEIEANATDVKYELCKKLDDILQSAYRSPTMMTDALRSAFQRCPSSLKWKPWTPGDNAPTQCFQARSADGHYYAINLITGEVLVDGLPPSRLPLSILDNPLYKRTFGNRNFEVVGKADFLETCYPIFERFYRFSKGSTLRIYEFKRDESEMLELLDGTASGIVWAKELPKRLKMMHSHWLFRGKNLIVLRDHRFKDRSISFLIKLKSNAGRNIEGQVNCVEAHSKKRDELLDLIQELDTMDKLVLHQSPAIDIISKFEPSQYMHSLISPPYSGGRETLRFFLPRYKLTLELRCGVLHCREIAGYHLVSQQQIDGTFRGISMYLLLEQTCGKGRLIIFPKGLVVRERQGQVRIEVPVDCDKQLLWYQYDFHHRFHYIESKQSRASRMQLAALHIATTTALPDELLGMTGEERAITLIRQSWGNRPLSEEECLILDNTKRLAHGLSPTLSILCQDIEISSEQLIFLHTSNTNHEHAKTECFEGTAYLNNVKNNNISGRCYLTPREESRLIGKQARKPTLPFRFISNQQLPGSPVTEHQMESLQKELDKCGSKSERKRKKPKLKETSFPLDVKPSSKLELDMINELKESWDAHVDSTSHLISYADVELKVLEKIQSDSVQLRQLVENFALDALNEVFDKNPHWHENAHEMLRIAGLVPTANTVDLAKIAIDPSVIRSFNPMLTNESHERLLDSISTWLRLCVYEDKISRLISFSKSGAIEDVIKELETVTVWDTSKHPYWLVFQVENAIMIRQEQYKVAQHLIDTPGDIIQLNMGLGKTRVILPMIVLYWSFKSESGGKFVRDKVTRLHFLSALFEEAYKYLQNHLTASCFEIKIYTMPFCRDFTLDSASINTMKNAIDDCRIDGGALVVAPEHRLSLELKAKELHRGGEKDISAQIENGIIKQDIWRDIFDEVDELLRHRYQLIYAIGTAVALPDGAHRWRAVQALFTALAQNEGLKSFLFLHPKACKLSVRSTAEWPEIQFFDGESLNGMLGDHLDRRSPRLLSGLLPKLADVILENPPHELKWLKDHRLKDDIKKAMIEKDYTSTLEILPEQQLSDVLALRGFLAGGVLRHCLLKRHRVDYGVARPGKKRLAVPFRFADTPDLRSEFAHPDCAIAFTVLAYYHDGLSKDEFMQALKSLMDLGENAQSNFYNSWFVAGSDVMKAEDPDSFESLDRIEKIDMTNSGQMEKMWHFYRHNMITIAFYLNACVFPNETDQFDSRLTATSWNLAQNPSNNTVGFSGTNDNHRILPLQVRQFFASHEKEPDEVLKNLDGTNGKMLDMIIKCTLEVRQLERQDHPCQSIINILREGAKGSMQMMHAIIDCGALLAGSDLHEISKNILSFLPVEKFGGVLFYDDENSQDWVILERSGRLLPKDISPITEKEAFAIYDEPRCRGTDLKLRSEAVALLTLAQKLCKDKLMQAAGRLRRLGRNQKLIIAGGSDVFTRLSEHKEKINSSSAAPTRLLRWGSKQCFEAKTVLSWAMKNTVESTAAGFPNWANQGLFFASTFGKDPQLSITEEILKLDDMYGKSFQEQTLVKLTKNAHAYHMKRTGGENKLHNSVKGIVESISNRVEEYGGDFTFSAAGCDEECERELELEIEEEEEAEVEVPSVQPANEHKWDFKKVLLCQSPKELPTTTTLLPRFMELLIKPTSLAKIKWSNKIYCTANFAITIACQADTSVLNSFLRVVNFILCFPNGNLLLVSEFEANGLLSLFWNSKSFHQGSAYQLLHSSLLRQSLDESTKIFLQRTLPSRGVVLNTILGGRLEATDVISESSMASLQLFAGECTYATDERKEALKSLLRVRIRMEGVKFCPCTEAERMVEMRGLGKLYPYSDLEALCEKLLCEI